MKFSKSTNYEEAVKIIKSNMASDYKKLGLDWDDDSKLTQYKKCVLRDILLEDEILGFFMVYENAGVYYLAELHIDDRFRNRGFGTKALAKIKAVASEEGYSEVRVGAFKDSSALKLYEKNGFNREKETEYTHELVATT